jgi:hypothetical protein
MPGSGASRRFPDAGRIAMLYHPHRNAAGEPPQAGTLVILRPIRAPATIAAQLRDRGHSYSPASLTLSGDGDPVLVQGRESHHRNFQLLQVGAGSRTPVHTMRRTIPGAPTPVVILGHGLWTPALGSGIRPSSDNDSPERRPR